MGELTPVLQQLFEMMMGSRIGQTLLTSCIVLGITGCQRLTLPQSRPNSGQQPVTIKISGWGASPLEKKFLTKVLQDFERTHPHIRVKFETIADQYMDVLKTRLIGDAAPDLFYLDVVEAPFLMQAGVLEPLNDYVTPEFDLADFEPTLLNSFRQGKALYGLPKDYSTLALFYHKPLFKQVNLSPPSTWDEFRRSAKRLARDSDRDGKPEQYGFSLSPDLARSVYLMQAFGGRVVDNKGYAAFATAPVAKGLQPLLDQYQRDRTAIRPSDVGASSSSDLLGQGKVGMMIEGNWAIPYLKETFPKLDFGTAEVPKINGKSGTMVFTVAYVMNRKSRHKPEAWSVLSYLTGKVGMRTWTSSGFALPTRRSVAQQLRYDRDPLRSPLVAGVRYGTPWQMGSLPAPILNSFNNQFLSALLGEQPLQQALQRAQQSANSQISNAKQ
jgi:multiple sugar transport system substrate-binding protein